MAEVWSPSDVVSTFPRLPFQAPSPVNFSYVLFQREKVRLTLSQLLR